jgi:uncharacterized membrane protein
MKIVWIIIGALGGLFALVGIGQLVKVYTTTNVETAYGGSSLAAAVFPICLGLIACLYGFQKAFQKPAGG